MDSIVDSTFFDSIVSKLEERLDAPCMSSISMVDLFFLPLPFTFAHSTTLLSQFTVFTYRIRLHFARPISRNISSLSPLSSVLDRFLPTFVFFCITLESHALRFRAIVGRDLYFESFKIARHSAYGVS